MIPYLHIWRLNVPTFGLMLWLAAVAAAFVMDRGFRRAHISADGEGPDAIGMVAIAVIAGIVGAKLWHVIDTPTVRRRMLRASYQSSLGHEFSERHRANPSFRTCSSDPTLRVGGRAADRVVAVVAKWKA